MGEVSGVMVMGGVDSLYCRSEPSLRIIEDLGSLVEARAAIGPVHDSAEGD